jgi:integrase
MATATTARRADTITFATQSQVLIEELRTRKRDPLKPSSLAVYESYLKNWIVPLVGQQTLASFGTPEMRLFISLLAQSLKPKSVNEIVSLTKQIIASVVDVTEQPRYPRVWDSHRLDLPRVNPRQQKTPTISREDIERAIRDSSEPYSILYACLAGTGLRINEALAIRLDDPTGSHSVFDAESSTIHVRTGLWRGREQSSPKTAVGIRSVEVPSQLATMLTKFAGDRTGGFLFSSNGNGKPLNESTARVRLTKLGLPGFHAFRRYRTTFLRKQRAPEDLIRAWLGHSDGSITDHYSKLSSDHQFRRAECDRVGLGFELPRPKNLWAHEQEPDHNPNP